MTVAVHISGNEDEIILLKRDKCISKETELHIANEEEIQRTPNSCGLRSGRIVFGTDTCAGRSTACSA